MYVNAIYVMSCLYSAVSLTLVREQRFIRIIYYYYYDYIYGAAMLSITHSKRREAKRRERKRKEEEKKKSVAGKEVRVSQCSNLALDWQLMSSQESTKAS